LPNRRSKPAPCTDHIRGVEDTFNYANLIRNSMSVADILVIKCGNIATSTMVDLILDETASREDLRFTILGTGPKMAPEDTERISRLIPSIQDPNLILLVGPNAGAPGMVRIRKALKSQIVPWIVISDGPSRKVRNKLKKEGAGYLIMEADPLIGARREFLDPTEMAAFNSDVIKVLAATGSFRYLHSQLDQVIESLDQDQVYLPRKLVSQSRSLASAGFRNPFARAKAATAFRLSKEAASMNYRACFVEKDPKKYIRIAAAAHEMVRQASILADDAREMEKQSNSLLRTPHTKSGKILRKRSLGQETSGGKK